MGYLEWNYDGIKKDNYDLTVEAFPVGTSDDATLGLCARTMLGVNDYFKLGEKLNSKGGACLGVSEWSRVGIPEGIMLTDYSKLGEALGSKEDVSRGVYEWFLVGTTNGAILGTNVGNDE